MCAVTTCQSTCVEVREQLRILRSLSSPLCGFDRSNPGCQVCVPRVFPALLAILLVLKKLFYYVCVSMVCMYGCAWPSLLCETFIILHIPGHKIDKTSVASYTYRSAALFPPFHLTWKLQMIVTLPPPALLSPQLPFICETVSSPSWFWTLCSLGIS